MTEPTPPKRRRRWFSISLRGLMILILVLGGLMGWKARRASLQRRAVARIQSLGGSAYYDWQDQSSTVIRDAPSGPEWLRRFLGDEYFQEVVWVRLADSDRGFDIDPSLPDNPESEAAQQRDYRLLFRKAEEAVANDGLACLDGLDGIERLELDCTPLDSAGWKRLGRLSSLKFLTISNLLSTSFPVNDQGLVAISNLNNLEDIHASFKLKDKSSLDLLQRLPRLRALSVIDKSYVLYDGIDRSTVVASMIPDDIDDSFLFHFGKLQHLTELSIYGSFNITDAGLAHLKGLSLLEDLGLEQSDRVTDVGLAHLKELTNLKILALRAASNISDAGLAHLVHLKKLERLLLASTAGVTDAGIAHLVDLENLEWLELGSASRVTDKSFAFLAKMPRLTMLDLNASSISDAGLERFCSMTELRGLSLYGRKVGAKIIDHIKAAIPGLHIQTYPNEDESAAEMKQQDPVVTPPPVAPRN